MIDATLPIDGTRDACEDLVRKIRKLAVGEAGTTMYWFKVLDQDPINQKPLTKLMAALPGRRDVPRGSMSCIHWYL